MEVLGRGFAWLDTGTHESLHQAAEFVQVVQDGRGAKIACVEEIAFRMGYIDAHGLRELAKEMLKNEYGRYLLEVAGEG